MTDSVFKLIHTHFMKNFTLTLALAAFSVSAIAQSRPLSVREATMQESTQRNMEIVAKEKPMQSKIPRLRKGTPHKVAAPDYENDKVIDETPEGSLSVYQKFGLCYGYSWFTGFVYGDLDGFITHTVLSPDGSKFYIQNPVTMFFGMTDGWIEGDVDDQGVITFQFPQFINYELYDYGYGDIEEYYDYALLFEYVVEDEETQEGWYYPCEEQTYKMQLNADGTITSITNADIMIGQGCYFEEEDDEPAEWSWQGNGDFHTHMIEVTPERTGQEVIVPADVDMEEWQLKTDISSRKVYVGVKDDSMYITGLFNTSGMSTKAVMGKITDNSVVFETGQYLGEYWDNSTLAFFLAGKTDLEYDSNGESYKYFVIEDNITFSYDPDNKVVESINGAFCISALKDQVSYYLMVDKPMLCVPDPDINVIKLMTPILYQYWDTDEEYGFDAEIIFDIPTLDAVRNILQTDRIWYQVILNEEPYEFYADEYELPEGVTMTDMISYSYNSEYAYDFYAYGTRHDVLVKAIGFDTLGVRSLYKNPDGTIVYSDIMWCPGYEGMVKVNEISDAAIVNVKYFDLTGVEVTNPEKGIYVRKLTYSDGTVVTSKIARR